MDANRELQLLVLRAPGAQSDRLGEPEHLAAEIITASACPITDRLAELGFVRDYPGMAFYLGMNG